MPEHRVSEPRRVLILSAHAFAELIADAPATAGVLAEADHTTDVLSVLDSVRHMEPDEYDRDAVERLVQALGVEAEQR